MRLFNLPFTIPGQWITGFTVLALVIAPTACNTASIIIPGLTTPVSSLPSDPAKVFGVLLNKNPENGVLGGIRLLSGESAWAYGSLNDDGTIRQVTGLALRDKDGKEASLSFDGHGRPLKGRALDGSTLDLTYDDSQPDHIKGSLDLFVAASNDRRTIPFDVDLTKAAAQIAQIAGEFGIQISDKDLPSAPPRVRVIDLSGSPDGKLTRNGRFLDALIGVYVLAYATVGFLMVSIMTQVLELVVDFYVLYVATFVKVALIATFAPFIIMGNLLRVALEQPRFVFNFNLIGPAFVIPAPPR